MYILDVNFCAISFIRTQDLHFPKNSEKIVATDPLASYVRKNYIITIVQSKYIACKNFLRFHAIQSEIELSQEFWENLISSTIAEKVKEQFPYFRN